MPQILRSHYKEVTLDVSEAIVNGPHTFPVNIIFEGDTDLTLRARSDGKDIVVTNDTGETVQTFDIIHWNRTNGDLHLAVRLSISDSSDVTLRVYYGGNPDEDLSDTQSTWSTSDGWEFVYFPGASSGNIDRTGNYGSLTEVGSPTTAFDGYWGVYVDLDRSNNDAFDMPVGVVPGTSEMTMFSLMKMNDVTLSTDLRAITKQKGGTTDDHDWMLGTQISGFSAMRLRARMFTETAATGVTLIASWDTINDRWYLPFLRYNDSDATSTKLLVDDSDTNGWHEADTSATPDGDIRDDAASEGEIGQAQSSNFWDGQLGSQIAANTALDEDLLQSYSNVGHNQNTFVSFGNETDNVDFETPQSRRTHYKEITLDVSEAIVSGPHTIPVNIIFEGDTDLASKASDDGYDFILTDGYGDDIKIFDIIYWDSSSGDLHIAVRLEDIDDTDDVTLRLYYGGGEQDIHYDMVSTWSVTDGWEFVYFPGASSGNVDRTGNYGSLTEVGSPTTAFDGYWGVYVDLDRSNNDAFDMPVGVVPTDGDTTTIFSLMKMNDVTLNADLRALTKQFGGSEFQHDWMIGTQITNFTAMRIRIRMNAGAGDTIIANWDTINDRWYLPFFVYDGPQSPSTTLRLLVDDSDVNGFHEAGSSSDPSGDVNDDAGAEGEIGQAQSSNFWDGQLGQQVAANIVLDDNWLESYSNISHNQNTFVTIGAETINPEFILANAMFFAMNF